MSKGSIFIRLILLFLWCLLAIFLPWWIIIATVVICAFAFSWYLEGIVVALWIDALFAPSNSGLEGLIMTLVTAIIILTIEQLKPRLAFYH